MAVFNTLLNTDCNSQLNQSIMKVLKSNINSQERFLLKSEVTLPQAIKASGRLMIPIPGGFCCCMSDEILYMKAESNYTEIYFTNGTKKLLSKTLRILEDLLPAHKFFRVHKSYVVNASHIIEVMMTMETNVVKLSNGATLPISREKKNLFY